MIDVAQDKQAWELVCQGKQEGLAQLYDLYAPVMFRVAMRLLRNPRDAEDLLHDVFLEAWQKAGQYDAQRGSVRTWLLLRVRSRAIDRIRAATVARKYAVTMTPAIENLLVIDDGNVARTDGSTARRALAALSDKQRTVVELGYFQGLTCREIAEQCQIPIGTVKSRLAAGVAALRRQLRPESEALQ